MAERRMVSCGFLTSDAFLHLPLQARSLYIALLTAADDDGFVDNPEAVRKSWGLRKPALSQLLEAGLLLDFDGVVLLTHWLQHNRIPRDRYRPTRHTALLSQVLLGDAREYIRWRRLTQRPTRRRRWTRTPMHWTRWTRARCLLWIRWMCWMRRTRRLLWRPMRWMRWTQRRTRRRPTRRRRCLRRTSTRRRRPRSLPR